MVRVIGVGNQNFENIITNRYFYIDKTAFLKERWENGDTVTLITQPRRFGKTLNLSMVETFLYDTPLHEAYVNGYWEELICFIRDMFNAT